MLKVGRLGSLSGLLGVARQASQRLRDSDMALSHVRRVLLVGTSGQVLWAQRGLSGAFRRLVPVRNHSDFLVDGGSNVI